MARTLRERCVLLVGDEDRIVDDLRRGFETAGAEIPGRAGRVDEAPALV